jgi:hypothetical protein
MKKKFSRATIVTATVVMDNELTQAAFTNFVLSLGPNILIRGETVSVSKRTGDFLKYLDDNPDRQVGGDWLSDVFVEKLVARLPISSYQWESLHRIALLRALKIDGYTMVDGKLMHALPAEIELPEAEEQLLTLLSKHGFVTARGHLGQARVAHTRGDWAAANSQTRTFLDALLDEMAERLDPTAASLPSGQPRRERLASLDFFISGLNEWSPKGTGFINGLVRRLHPEGAHPGLSNEDDSTFRLHLVLLTTDLLLKRFDAMKSP